MPYDERYNTAAQSELSHAEEDALGTYLRMRDAIERTGAYEDLANLDSVAATLTAAVLNREALADL